MNRSAGAGKRQAIAGRPLLLCLQGEASRTRSSSEAPHTDKPSHRQQKDRNRPFFAFLYSQISAGMRAGRDQQAAGIRMRNPAAALPDEPCCHPQPPCSSQKNTPSLLPSWKSRRAPSVRAISRIVEHLPVNSPLLFHHIREPETLIKPCRNGIFHAANKLHRRESKNRPEGQENRAYKQLKPLFLSEIAHRQPCRKVHFCP